MRPKILLLLWLFAVSTLVAQSDNFNSQNLRITPLVSGTLMIPDVERPPLVILIAGSGPTDRDGNQQMMKNNSLRYLAEDLYKQGVASFRYDKRIVQQMKDGSIDERQIRFQDFIDDAATVIERFKTDDNFSRIVVIGHSQGSLVGMVAAQGRADGFVSIAGAGQEIDDVIVDQLSKQAPGLVDNARQSFDDLRVNGVAQNFSPGLASIFRSDIQPFILTWMQYDPKIEIGKLDMPVLIINGEKDLQVQVSEAQILKDARPDAQMIIIPKMNHIFKEIEGSDMDNAKSYNDYKLPVMPELVDAISGFVKN